MYQILIYISELSHGIDRITNMVSHLEQLNYMFSRFTSQSSLDLSGFDTSNNINMIFLLENCESLISLNLYKFNTSKVTKMNNIIYNCKT